MRLAPAVLAAIALASDVVAAPQRSYAPEGAPDQLARGVEAADAAIAALQARLATRLLEELAKGPLTAVAVCRDEAQALTAETARQKDVSVGRTSDRLRNPLNAPRPWAAPFVEAGRGRRAAEVDAVVVDLGERVGVLRPIPTGAVCTTCHGPRASLGAELAALLKASYPQDRALGYAEGDLRGFFWAEAAK